MPRQHGITTDTVKRYLIDSGAVYRDYDETGEELIGATRGGAEFVIEKEDREVEVDGPRGPVRGLKRTIRHTARLSFTLIEISQQTLLDLTRGTSVSDGTHRLITPDNDIVDGDYYTNIALVGEMAATSDPIVIKLLNSLVEGEITFTTDDQNEGEVAVTVMAHYGGVASLDTVPYTIALPVNAS